MIDVNKYDPEKLVVCSSYPKCGSHLISDILEMILGFPAYISDESILRNDRYVSERPRNTFLSYHNLNYDNSFFEQIKRENGVVLLNLRDPRDMIVSYYFFILKNVEYHSIPAVRVYFYKDGVFDDKDSIISRLISGAGYFKDEFGEDTYRHGYPARMVYWFNGYVLKCSMNKIPFIITRFEDWVYDKEKTIRTVTDFLGYNIGDSEINEIIIKTSFDGHNFSDEKMIKRIGLSGDWKNHFSKVHNKLYLEYCGLDHLTLGYSL